MAALRALVFAIFGGFIAAAPATPGGTGDTGYADPGSRSQKREQAGYEVVAPATPTCAGAPPSSETPPAAGLPPSAGDVSPVAHAVVAARAYAGRAVRPSAEDVRAGLLDLPPPAR